MRILGAMVARLTPDQKVACSIHVGFKTLTATDPFYRQRRIFVGFVALGVAQFGYRAWQHDPYPLGPATLATTFNFREKVVETYLVPCDHFPYITKTKVFKVNFSRERYHFWMSQREPRSTLAVRASRERNDYFSAKQFLRFFLRQMEIEQPSRLVIGRTGVSDHEIQTNAESKWCGPKVRR